MTPAAPDSDAQRNTYRAGPDEFGHFGIFGGRFVAETLMSLILEVERAYDKARNDPAFQAELKHYLAHYVGRPSPLYFAERLTGHFGGAKIYFKRDELNHTGAHKINNCLGQMLLARRMGKTRIIAETGAGQHGVATATVCALFDLPCTVYMGTKDIERQAPNVFRMKLLGAEVKPVTSGSNSLKDAMNEALRDWVANVENTFYIIGTVAGPHPYPAMVRDFQSIIGREAREQIMAAEGRLPDTLVACIGGGSNAMGLFHPFLDDKDIRMIGVEAAGEGVDTGRQSAHHHDSFAGQVKGKAPRDGSPHLGGPAASDDSHAANTRGTHRTSRVKHYWRRVEPVQPSWIFDRSVRDNFLCGGPDRVSLRIRNGLGSELSESSGRRAVRVDKPSNSRGA